MTALPLSPRLFSLPSPLVDPLSDNVRLVELISSITSQPLATVRRRLCEEERCLGINVAAEMQRRRIPAHRWSDALLRFYQDADAFLYELLAHNRNAEKILMRQWIGRFLAGTSQSPRDVLAFGDGLGFDSLYLTQAGHRVTYFEVSDKSRRFAAQIFDAAGVAIPIQTKFGAIRDASYDAVLCLDVLEHVPQPKALVGELTRLLRPGGFLIVSAPFFMVSAEFPTHLRMNRQYSGSIRRLYGSHGLQLVDGRAFFNPIVLGKPPVPWGGWAQWRRRLHVRLGQWLLKVARVWSWPHVAVGRALQGRGQGRWCQGLETATEPRPGELQGLLGESQVPS